MSIVETRPQIIIRNGKPQAVILDIKKYEKLLESIDDKEDLAELRRIKKSKTSFRELKNYLGKRV
ncbi:MAG: type II toxin-antitoxin system Phd/YefM family antitoxin [Candidatus Sungbacteria bacterium]|nr:type II toxin-antitoxin system Phd/YefM family antitoxin [Candidatus Sungbacteria bacterium]